MTSLYGDADDITRVLDDTSLWFVVGLGNNPARVAFEVAAALQGRGKRKNVCRVYI